MQTCIRSATWILLAACNFSQESHAPQLQARSHEPDRYMAGIRETVLMGLLGMHMEGRKLTASGLAGLSLFDFSRAFSLPLTVEKEVMPGVRQDVAAPHRPLVEAMHRTLQDGCRILGERNFTR